MSTLENELVCDFTDSLALFALADLLEERGEKNASFFRQVGRWVDDYLVFGGEMNALSGPQALIDSMEDGNGHTPNYSRRTRSIITAQTTGWGTDGRLMVWLTEEEKKSLSRMEVTGTPKLSWGVDRVVCGIREIGPVDGFREVHSNDLANWTYEVKSTSGRKSVWVQARYLALLLKRYPTGEFSLARLGADKKKTPNCLMVKEDGQLVGVVMAIVKR